MQFVCLFNQEVNVRRNGGENAMKKRNKIGCGKRKKEEIYA